MSGYRHELFLEREDAKRGFHRAGQRKAVPGQALGAADVRHPAIGEDGANGAAFADVAGRCSGAVGVDVIHLVGRELRVAQGFMHGADEAGAGRIGRENIVAVGSLAPAEDFSANRRTALPGVIKVFKDKNHGTAGADETVAFEVEGARRFFRVGLNAESTDAGKWEDVKFIAILSSDNKNCVLPAKADEVAGEAERMSGRGTGTGAAKRGALNFEHGDEVDVKRAGNAVDDAHRLAASDAAGEHGVEVFIGEPH